MNAPVRTAFKSGSTAAAAAAPGAAEVERLDKELATLLGERQWVITQARKRKISKNDMDSQRAELDSLNTPPQHDEEAHEQFEDKRRIV